jgi:hypothetical protein
VARHTDMLFSRAPIMFTMIRMLRMHRAGNTDTVLGTTTVTTAGMIEDTGATRAGDITTIGIMTEDTRTGNIMITGTGNIMTTGTGNIMTIMTGDIMTVGTTDQSTSG